MRLAVRWRPAARLAAAGRRFATTAATASTASTTTASSAASTTASSTASDNVVRIVEVGPRDGLQNEKTTVPLATKIELIERLARTGLSTIEAGSFVAPKWVPQMDNSSAVLEHILQHRLASPAPISYAFLVPNAQGLATAAALLQQHAGAFATDRPPVAPAAAVDGADADADASSGSSSAAAFPPAVELAVFAAATDSFSRQNLNCDMATSLERFREVIQGAKQLAAGAPGAPPLRVRAYISVVLGCPFEGYDVDPRRVAAMATDLLEMGADEIALGDTTGMGTAPRTQALLRCVTAAGVRLEDVALHLHDTYGQALVNTAVALEHGIRTFDSAVGGLGGCPYSPGATGNVATETLVYFLESLGMHTGVDLDAVADIGAWISAALARPHDSSVGKAVLGARARAA